MKFICDIMTNFKERVESVEIYLGYFDQYGLYSSEIFGAAHRNKVIVSIFVAFIIQGFGFQCVVYIFSFLLLAID